MIEALAPTRISGRFIKGIHVSSKTEFKKGSTPWSKLNPDYQNGNKHWHWKGGKPKCLECGKQLAAYKAKYCSNHAHRGSLNWRWKEGISPLRKSIRRLQLYRLWRNAIFERDNFKCVLCGDGKSNNLNADHYPISFADILQSHRIKTLIQAEQCNLLWSINNGRTLCVSCHKKTPNYLVKK